jgi:hypothetical protein
LAAQSHLSTLGSSLTSTLPSYLATSERLDASHATFVKEALVRYGTLSSDLGRETMEMGEKLLVAVLGVDEPVEMQTWALRESIRAGATAERPTGVNGGEFGVVNGATAAREAETVNATRAEMLPPPVPVSAERPKLDGESSLCAQP